MASITGNNRKLDDFIYRIGQNNPKYQSFISASGIKARVVKPQSLYDSLMLVHGARMNAYKFYWDMYFYSHWHKMGDDNPNPITVNYAAKVVTKHSHFLMNKGFLVESDFFEIDKYIQNNWKLNNGGSAEHNEFGQLLALQGGVTGDSWVLLSQVRDPVSGVEYTKYDVLESTKSFPVFDNKKMRGFLYYGPYSAVKDENFGFATYTEKYEGYYLQRGRKTFIANENAGGVELYDILDLPIVHIFNIKTVVSNYGISDLLNVSDLNKTYNALMTEIQDIIEYHASPITILTGASGSQLTKQANRLWSIPKDASVSNLELRSDLGATIAHLENIKKSIAEMGNVPLSSLGDKQNISNTSGSALAITFMPLYEVMEYKRIMYGIGIMNLSRETIRLAFIRGLLSPHKIIKDIIKEWKGTFGNYSKDVKDKYYPFSNKIDSSVNYDSFSVILDGYLPKELFETYLTWFPPLPRDEKNLSDEGIALTNSKIYSRRKVRSMLGMSEKDSLLMDKEIEKEVNNPAYAEPLTMTNRQFDKKPKTGLEGNDDVKGDKESRRRELNV